MAEWEWEPVAEGLDAGADDEAALSTPLPTSSTNSSTPPAATEQTTTNHSLTVTGRCRAFHSWLYQQQWFYRSFGRLPFDGLHATVFLVRQL